MNVLELISKGECDEVEFKSTIPKDLAKSICAFANANGGYIIIGITDRKRVVGTDPEKIKERVAASLSSLSPIPKIEITDTTVEGKDIVIIHVKKSKDLITSGGSAYIRIGRSVRIMELQEILKKASELAIVEFDEHTTNLSTQEINKELLGWLVDSRNQHGYGGDINKVLRALRLVKGDKLTFAGALFLHPQPQEIYPQTRIRLLINDEWQSIEGPFKNLVKTTMDILRQQIRFISLYRGDQRIDFPSFSEKAFREAIVNALVHRNYALGGETFVKITPDQISIENPGSFPPGVHVSDPKPLPRNRWIYETAFQTGFVEKIGSGIELIKKEAAHNPFFDVEFLLESGWTKVVFKRTYKTLDKTKSMIISFLVEPRSSSEIATFIGKSKPTTLSLLKELESMGLVKTIGTGRWQKWIRTF